MIWRWLSRILGKKPAAEDEPDFVPFVLPTRESPASAESVPLEVSDAVIIPEAPPRTGTPPQPIVEAGPAAVHLKSKERRLPSKIAFVDVETTGLTAKDRIVSIAVIMLETRYSRRFYEGISLDFMHLITDPCRKSHPAALQAHGHDDWVLRHQDLFAEHAALIRDFIQRASAVAAHNASFDVPFINRELELAGLPHLDRPIICTMNDWRKKRSGGWSLNAACRQLGISRRGEEHNALEDAYLSMRLYHALNELPFYPKLDALPPLPSNWREPPPRPEGALPRRRPRKAPKPVTSGEAAGL